MSEVTLHELSISEPVSKSKVDSMEANKKPLSIGDCSREFKPYTTADINCSGPFLDSPMSRAR